MLGATINVKHVGDSYLDQGNTFRLQPYTVTDASVFYQKGPVLVTLSALNTLDTRYYTMGDIENGQSIDPAAPRQIVLSSSLHLR